MENYKRYILDNQEKIITRVIQRRDFYFDRELLSLNKIVSFVGPRRAWKTYTMYQVLRELIEEQALQKEQIVFIDFSEFIEKQVDFLKILESFYELFPDKEPFFVFDEIQEIENFRQWVLSLFNRWFHIFLSGSNSHLLSSELSTHFRWRIFEYRIFSLSFREFVRFRWYSWKEWVSTREYAQLKNLLNEYITYWGYPEIALIERVELKENILRDYFSLMIYRDIIERYSINNEYVLRYLMRALILWNTKELNIHKIFNELKSQNISVSKNTLYNYIEYLENVFFIKKIHNVFSPKWAFKTYLTDTGYTRMYSLEADSGKNFENAVLFELLRHNETLMYKKWDIHEIDFCTQESDIQACFDLNPQNSEREIWPLLKSNAKNAYIVAFESSLNNTSFAHIRWFETFFQ